MRRMAKEKVAENIYCGYLECRICDIPLKHKPLSRNNMVTHLFTIRGFDIPETDATAYNVLLEEVTNEVLMVTSNSDLRTNLKVEIHEDSINLWIKHNVSCFWGIVKVRSINYNLKQVMNLIPLDSYQLIWSVSDLEYHPTI